nr:hypothetical protein [Paludibacterium denitrificans]
MIDGGTLPYFENPQQWERTGNALFHQINDGLVAQAEVRLLTGQGRSGAACLPRR